MVTKQQVTTVLAVVNSLLGIASFSGPLVTGNRDRIINIRPGFLFGIFAVNWLHALLHLVIGILGIPYRASERDTQSYLRLHGLLFSMLSLLGWWKARSRQRMYFVMGMALDVPGTIVHSTWALLGLWFGFAAKEQARDKRLAVDRPQLRHNARQIGG